MFTLFRRKPRGNDPKADAAPQPLRIEGTHTRLTPEPDDAELAAQALLEMMAHEAHKTHEAHETHNPHTPAYYHALADRIREAHRKSAQQATRFVAACEHKLQNKHLPAYGPGSLQLLEVELYKRIDIIEREGGELKNRWQHCLAEVTVRLMDDIRDNPENIL